MIFPAEMERVEIAFLSEDRERVLESLQREGVVEIDETDKGVLRGVDVDTGEVSSLHVRSEKIIRDTNARESFLGSVLGNGKGNVFSLKKEQFNEVFENSKRFIDFFENNISGIKESIKSNEKEISYALNQTEILKFVRDLDVDFSEMNSLKNVFYFVGKCDKGMEKVLGETVSKFHVFSHSFRNGNDFVLFLMGMKNIEEYVGKAISSAGVEIFDTSGFGGKPTEMIPALEERVSVLIQENERLKGREVEFLEEWLPELKKTNSILKTCRERMKSLSLIKQTGYVSFATGFVPKKRKVNIIKAVDRATLGRMFVNFEKTDEGPTKLENPNIVKRFEIFTKGFGLPKNMEIDPTIFISMFFPVMFGLMLSDVFYGMIMVCVAFGIRLYAKNDLTMDFSRIMVLCGVSAMAWGLLFGSFMGNFLGFNGLLLSPTGNPVSLLLLALGIGMAHINLGFILSAVQKIKSRKSVIREISWFLIETGGGLLILNMFNVINGLVFYPSAALLAAGILIKISRPSNLINMMSFFGNVLSYVRLAAICLATAYIALTINHITSIILPASFALAAVFFVFGHIFNCTISSVGAFVNSLRLQYVEFFSSFFTGEGRRFIPLKFDKGIELIE
ncbi:MAG: V-type ATP synthase subunit I [Candidatus Aenigmarchaeota archaeon]|nr:V-type ATP synthase subunit I [Candidatus Aenigmarchaeota archaeon]